ncbi:MAG: DUF1015 domain-containing protein [Candidatus Margulisbacteria bacterium]|nr:DUF1015 domain-containing protein [Candidatus Margulisiibacteriota bacterium]MBU1021757.1 DUF1015 domain-containing protein [Candidatus Margulisiibacteriota bacterium]MBU1729503.1 DUF1015 domain-containing protein [Candidatus Margulisiibacteriota bacterium]MBU1955396.1 DUF1015 domain-containing protein [Candidatus Margulisiibacteriota bacterium]
MVRIFPFNGITYNPDMIKNLSKVMAPPYDVISPEEQDQLYNLHDYNVIRLILGKEFAEDTNYNNKYIRAAKYFEGFLLHKIMTRSEKPCLYVYEQTFIHNRKKHKRIGLISLLRLEDFGKGKVFPHEETFPKAKTDRLSLLHHTYANFESIFSIFSDTKLKMTKYLKKFTKRKPLIQAKDKDKVIHKIWAIDKKSALKKIMRDMKDKWVFIADGHHRYEAALKFKDEVKEKTQRFSEEEPYNYILMYFTPIEDKGLLVLPIHRVVKINLDNFDPIQFEGSLHNHFKVEVLPFKKSNEKRVRAKLFKLLEKNKDDQHSFGVYMGGNKYLRLTLKDEKLIDEFITDNKPKTWKKLDVNVLHTFVIDMLLGIKKGSHEAENNIKYVKSEDLAVDLVNQGKYGVAFFLNPTSVKDIIYIASKYEKMPQKSTYFYPKLLSGLVLNKIDLKEKIKDEL